MLQKITLQCKYEGEQKASYNWGSIFHGIIMEMLPLDIAEEMHQSKLKPFSQYVTPCPDNQLQWNIGLWDEYAADHILHAIMPMTSIAMKHKGMQLEVTNIQRTSLSENEFLSRFFTVSSPCRRYEIEFRTPCTHKQEGSYVMFPGIDLMINNLSRRFSAFIQDYSLNDPEAMEQVIRNIRIVRYSLHSSVYYLEQTKITGYIGRMTVVINGPDQLARLAGAILSFAEYSGIGIKTALGMGGTGVKEVL